MRTKRDVSAAKRTAVLAADSCHYCGDVLLPREVEHHVPLTRGGTNDLDNLVAACVSCNSDKRARLVHEWRAYRQTNGLPWPPLASHPVEPIHYKDRCADCLTKADLDNLPAHRFVVVPYDLQHNGRGSYTAYYHCPAGHAWKCWFVIDRGYYSDCPCAHCHTSRDDNGGDHRLAVTSYV